MKIISILCALLLMVAVLIGTRKTSRQRVSRPDSISACVVQRITDGDSLWCDGHVEVRLLGIDAPEMNQVPQGSRSRQALLALLPPGSSARLETDVRERDQYHRLLAYVWRGDTLINVKLVHDGWAMLYTVPPNVRYVDRIRVAQDSARALGAGLWADDGFNCVPSEHRKGRC